jgi:hypothetical protein
LVEGNDVGGIDVGFLVRSDVTINSTTQIGKATTSTWCSGASPCLLNDRPPLLLDATTSGGYHFAVLVIHNRSLSSIDDPTDGNRVRHKRLEQSQYVGEIVQKWQTGNTGPMSDGTTITNANATVPLVVVGDFNAYEFTDGYVDVTGQIKGSIVPADNMVSAPPITSPSLCEAGLTADPATRYSFMFDGYVQDLDHSLFTRRAWMDFLSVGYAHGNADTSEAGPEVTDPNTAARSADHDGQVVRLVTDRIFADGFEDPTTSCQ